MPIPNITANHVRRPSKTHCRTHRSQRKSAQSFPSGMDFAGECAQQVSSQTEFRLRATSRIATDGVALEDGGRPIRGLRLHIIDIGQAFGHSSSPGSCQRLPHETDDCETPTSSVWHFINMAGFSSGTSPSCRPYDHLRCTSFKGRANERPQLSITEKHLVQPKSFSHRLVQPSLPQKVCFRIIGYRTPVVSLKCGGRSRDTLSGSRHLSRSGSHPRRVHLPARLSSQPRPRLVNLKVVQLLCRLVCCDRISTPGGFASLRINVRFGTRGCTARAFSHCVGDIVTGSSYAYAGHLRNIERAGLPANHQD